MTALQLVTAPSFEVLSLDEAKDHLQVELDDTSRDAEIDALVAAVRAHLDGRDGILGRALVTQTWRASFHRFPLCGGAIPLTLPPVQSVTSIQYVDPDGATQTFAAANYDLSAATDWWPRIDLAYGASWPATRSVPDAVTVTFVCGYGAPAAVPAPIRHAIKLMLREIFDNPGGVTVGAGINVIPHGASRLLLPYKVAGLV